ncbi:zinc ABC transporter substrate-binding protein [Oceanicola sp. S124]|uniref:zinc ABC transporter substrate-binding protein n=1 Tax=Oceanicola sp. S124 TaxID=1042378 RepID=UPI0002559340|nr:zinc ABC transporter substrate-binding protein [Oceanicola sp. S124]
MTLKPTGAALAALALSVAPLRAEVPQVVTDIAPVHSLVAQVMGDLADPGLILPPGASPHGYALRPSLAGDLQEADVVFWIGEALTPWLEGPLERLAGGALQVELIEAPGTTQLPYREGATLQEPHAGHAESETGHEAGHEGHFHDELDPHAWLDPENARAWLSVIAKTLAEADPEHATLYRSNADAAREALADQQQALAAAVQFPDPLRFVVFHDGYQYFEHRFGLKSLGAISDSAAASPGAARIAELRDALLDQGIDCIFAEPQFNSGLARSLSEDAALRIEVIDPLGSGLSAGPKLYGQLLDDMARSFSTCRAPA